MTILSIGKGNVNHTYTAETFLSRRNICIGWMDWHKNMIVFTMHIQNRENQLHNLQE